MRYVEKCGTARQTIGDNKGHALFYVGKLMLQTHALRIRKAYCCSTAIMAAQMHLNIA
jgi:hypothetical protein